MLRRLAEVVPEGTGVARDRRRSPDGTGELAEQLGAELGFVDVLHHRAQGGPRPCLPHAASGGHSRTARPRARDGLRLLARPGRRPRLIAAAEDADIVLGSRYVEGRRPQLEPGRRFISAGGSFYARVLLGLSIRDLTGGFKCIRRRSAGRLDLDRIDSKGYAFQIETTYRAIICRLPRPRDPDHLRRPGRLAARR